MGRLGLQVIAEGVGRGPQLEFLAKVRACLACRGYLLAHAVGRRMRCLTRLPAAEARRARVLLEGRPRRGESEAGQGSLILCGSRNRRAAGCELRCNRAATALFRSEPPGD